jgi:hypothetical protein
MYSHDKLIPAAFHFLLSNIKINIGKRFSIMITLLLAGWLSAFAQPSVIYVSADGNGDGSSYDLPTSLTDALAQAQSIDSSVLYLKPGIYGLTHTLEIILSTGDKTGITMIGGIQADGSISHDNELTILDGGDSLRILHLNTLSQGGMLTMDIMGMTFRNGYTGDDGDPWSVDHGGAILAYEGNYDSTGVINLAIEHCKFLHNSAANSVSGGAIFSNCLLRLYDCEFRGNEAYNGGAIYTAVPPSGSRSSVVEIEKCNFEGNRNHGNQGSSIYHNLTLKVNRCFFQGMMDGTEVGPGSCIWADPYSTTYISHSAFSNLICTYWGAAFQTWGGNAYIDNCVFKDNKAGGVSGATDGYGALAFYKSSSPATIKRITNCTFSGNYSRYGAATYGGAIHNRGHDGDDFKVTNCIFWGNGTMPVVTQTGVATIAYSNIEGSTLTGFQDGGNNINSDPLFADTLLHLLSQSPCRNTGTNTFEPDAVKDFDGNPRILSETIDMGAYEVNMAPDSLWLSNLSFEENLDSGTVVATVYGRDPDPEDANALRFGFPPPQETGDTDNHLFALDGSNLKFLSIGDYETDSLYTIHLGVLDAGDSVFSKTFTLKLIDSNDPVMVNGSVTTPQSVKAGESYSYTYPEDLFYDQDGLETVTITASLDDGTGLPAWLSFDPGSRTFSGTPQNADADSLDIKIQAEDSGGAAVSVNFGLKVESTVGVFRQDTDGIRIFPNPAEQYTTIHFKDSGKERMIRLFSLTGECVLQTHTDASESFLLELSNFPPGIYLLETVGNNCFYRKLVIQ